MPGLRFFGVFHSVVDNFPLNGLYVTDVRGPVTGGQTKTWKPINATTAIDTTRRCLYFHTYGNRRVRMLDLMKMKRDAPMLTVFPMDRHEDVQELIAP